MITSKRTFTQSLSSFSVFIVDDDFNRFITRLQRKPFRSKLLFHGGTYQDTTLAMFGLRTSVDAYSAASGHVPDK